MIKNISTKLICTLLATVIACTSTSVSFSAFAGEKKKTFDDVTISILGDSISTYENYSNGNAAKTSNTTIKDYPAHYKNNRYGLPVEATWWMQTINEIGAELLVNNSYSGSKVYYPGSSSTSLGYLNRATSLHDNTGDNAGQKPDIIAVYLGTNDISSCQEYLGNASDIDYETLIKKSGNGYSYTPAETTVEAYAVMLHKMKHAYPDAEIYCFTILPRPDLSTENKNFLKTFNSSIKKIAKHFNCYVVDLYTYSGITFKQENLEKYIADIYLHPGEYGMDAISNCFLSSLYKNSKYLSENKKAYNVNYVLNENIAITEGTKTATLSGEPFHCSISKLVYGKTDVKVTMAGKDITENCYINGEIDIPYVTGDIEISIAHKKVDRSFDSYRWEVEPIDNAPDGVEPEFSEPETNDPEPTKPEFTLPTTEPEATEPPVTEPEATEPPVTEPETTEAPATEPMTTEATEPSEPETTEEVVLTTDIAAPELNLSGFVCNDILNIIENENTQNTLHNITGLIENGIISSGEFISQKPIELFYDKPWSLVWNTKYTSPSSKHIVFSENEVAETEGNMLIHIQEGTSILAVAQYQDGKYHNLGIDLSAHGIYIQDTHTYKLVNVPGLAGTNTIQLYVDGQKIGSLTKYYVDNEYMGTNNSLFYYKDFILKHIGTADRPINKCILNYIQVWEDTVPETHIHDHIYHTETHATCTTDGCLNTLCDCGHSEKIILQPAYGHSAIDWVITQTSTVYSYGIMKRICIRCNKAMETKIIPQKICSTPKLSSAKNGEIGVVVSWKKTEGADSYKVYRKLKGGKWAYLKTTTGCSVTDTKAKSGKVYYYTVRAINEAGVSPYNSKGVGVVCLATPKLKSIANTKKGITIKWSKSTGAKHYRVYKQNAKGSWELVKQTTATSFTDTKVSSGKKYKYTVRAVYSSHLSGFVSKGISLIRLGIPKLVSASSNKKGIVIKWSKISGADGYIVYRKTEKGNWTKITTIKQPTTTTFTDTSAKKGKVYYYTVKAYSGSCYGCYNSKGIKGVRK